MLRGKPYRYNMNTIVVFCINVYTSQLFLSVKVQGQSIVIICMTKFAKKTFQNGRNCKKISSDYIWEWEYYIENLSESYVIPATSLFLISCTSRQLVRLLKIVIMIDFLSLLILQCCCLTEKEIKQKTIPTICEYLYLVYISQTITYILDAILSKQRQKFVTRTRQIINLNQEFGIFFYLKK